MTKKQKTITLLSICAIGLTLTVIIVEAVKLYIVKKPPEIIIFPTWNTDPEDEVGSIVILQETSVVNPWDLEWPIVKHYDERDRTPEAYPAAYCEKCKKPFAFVTKKYKPGMKPEKCPHCGNTDKKALIVLGDVKKVFDLKLQGYFHYFHDPIYLKKWDLYQYTPEGKQEMNAEKKGE